MSDDEVIELRSEAIRVVMSGSVSPASVGMSRAKAELIVDVVTHYAYEQVMKDLERMGIVKR